MSTNRGLAIISVALLIGCGEPGAPEAATSEASPPSTAKPVSLADIFPDGPERTLLFDSCGSCHALACAAIGQRTAARWDNLKQDHKDKVAGMSAEDLDALFAYLSENFDAAKPEPKIPPQFLEGGCTPF